MKTKITFIALLMLGFSATYANNLDNNGNNDTDKKTEKVTNDDTAPRVYYWQVENAHGLASGYVTSMEKAENMIKKTSTADYNRVLVVQSNPLKK